MYKSNTKKTEMQQKQKMQEMNRKNIVLKRMPAARNVPKDELAHDTKTDTLSHKESAAVP